jgi:acetoin utilization deacetylase AcuC-like enzyme
MDRVRATTVVADPRYRDHRGPSGHPECPDRLAAVQRAIDARRDRLEHLEPREAQPEEILRVHSRDHLDRVAEAARRAPCHLDPDTFVSPESFAVARLASGGTIDLARTTPRPTAPWASACSTTSRSRPVRFRPTRAWNAS